MSRAGSSRARCRPKLPGRARCAFGFGCRRAGRRRCATASASAHDNHSRPRSRANRFPAPLRLEASMNSRDPLRFGFHVLWAGIAALSISAPRPLAAQSGLTIYNDGRVLVRRTLATAVPSGMSTHRLGFGALDPASVFALDSGVTVIGGAYDEAVDEQNTMRRAVGQPLKFLTGGRTNNVADTVTATVVGVNPERFRLADGRIVFQRPGLPLY